MKSNIFGLLIIGAVGFLGTVAHGDERETIGDRHLIPLTTRGLVNRLDFQFNYPGSFGGFVRSGVEVHGFNAPDCLIVHQNTGPMIYKKMQRFLSQIEVRDGSEILFGTPLKARLLQPKFVKGTFVYSLTDLGTYVTGIEIRTVDSSKTFLQIAEDAMGDEIPTIGLTVSRGCTLVLL
ncbi:MAG: hypothetical protein NTV34_00635 [Proteobacteria bacterium]|nr:hypothetical protein [Pseudomonadota bacterium]